MWASDPLPLSLCFPPPTIVSLFAISVPPSGECSSHRLFPSPTFVFVSLSFPVSLLISLLLSLPFSSIAAKDDPSKRWLVDKHAPELLGQGCRSGWCKLSSTRNIVVSNGGLRVGDRGGTTTKHYPPTTPTTST